MADPLRSLYLVVGVRGRTATISDLRAIRKEADGLASSFLNAAAASQMLGSGSRGIASQAAVARQQVAGMRREVDRLGNSMEVAGRRGSRAFGLGTSLFLTYTGARIGRYGFTQGATLERESLSAAFASGLSQRSQMREARNLQGAFNLRLGAASRQVREVAQLGIEDPSARAAIARAGAGLSTLQPEISPADASASIYRLLAATARGTSTEERSANLYRMGRAAEYYASAIKIAGDSSAAGVPAVLEMVRQLQQAGIVANFSAEEIIALSGAFADLMESSPELFRSSLLRLFSKEFYDEEQSGLLGQFLVDKGSIKNMEEFRRLVGEDPAELLKRIADAFRRTPVSQRQALIGQIFPNVRDTVTVATMVTELDKFTAILDEIEADRGKRYFSQLGSSLDTLQSQFTGMMGAMDAAAASATMVLAPAAKVLMTTFKGLALTVANNPLLAGLLGAGATFFGFKAGAGLLGKYGPEFMAAGATRASRVGLTDILLGASMLSPRGIRRGMGGLAARWRGGTSALSLAASERAMLTYSGAAAGRTGIMSRFGAGMLGLFGGRAGGRLAGRMGASMLGRGALAGTGIGLPIAIMSMLAHPLTELGNMLDRLGDKGGVLGLVAESLGFVLKLIGQVGNGINAVFGWMWSAVKKLLDILHINDVATWAQKGLDKLTGGSQKQAEKAARKAAEGSGGGASTAGALRDVNVTVVGSSQSAFQVAWEQAAYRSAFGSGSQAYGGLP